MSFDWKLLLTVAKDLASVKTDGDKQEANCRTGVSRAYYAAFGVACNYLRNRLNVTLPRKDKHSFVRKSFAIKKDLKSVEVATLLHQLSSQRVMADYEQEFPRSAEKAEFCIGRARKLIGILEGQLNSEV